jgi:hypothetical protein
MSRMSSYTLLTSLTLFTVLGLTACGGEKIKTEAQYPSGMDRTTTGGDIYGKQESIFGAGGIFGGGSRGKEADDGSSGVAVNSYLWRASLDTVSFMPLASADPFGGVILTDWYTDPKTPKERYKVNVFILGKQLRSDGVRVRVFKQVSQKGTWFDTDVPADMGRQLEDTILTRARQLRSSQSGETE